MNKTTRWMVLAALLSLGLPALAADPPGLINYQGVLRNADDEPLDGTYDMIFRFYDDVDPADPENEIFVDEHLAAGTGAVTVTGGLFDVLLGSGNFYDGTGPGDHPHIFYVFGLHETVYLEVQVGAERLQPRMQVVSAPYAVHAVVLGGYVPNDFINTTSEEQEKSGLLRALGGIDFGDGDHDDLTANEVTHLTSGPATYADFLHQHAYADNADTVDGKHANEFIDTSPTSQTKTGMLTIDSSAQTASTALSAFGGLRGGIFASTEFSGQAQVATFDTGINATGETAGGTFSNGTHLSHATLADASYGIDAGGPVAGGYFTTDTGTGYAYVGYLDEGISAHGDVQGGYFEDNQGTSNAHIAYGDRGVEAYGQEAGGYFKDLNGPGEAYVGYSDTLGNSYGVWATAGTTGGYFESTGQAGYAYVGDGPYGIYAAGDDYGGFFRRNDWSAQALLASHDLSGDAYGIQAWGDAAGGGFHSNLGSGEADLAVGHIGIEASGEDAGGIFLLQGTPTQAGLAWRDPSGAEYGVHGRGVTAGGSFHNHVGSGEAYAAKGDVGIEAYGDTTGGHFSNGDGGEAYVGGYASASYGMVGIGDFAGGAFRQPDYSAIAELGYWDLSSGELLGIWAEGTDAGGKFQDGDGGTGIAYIATGDRGVWAAGSFAGGTFADTLPVHTNVFADVARTYGNPPTAFYKIMGNGTPAFVQNHPHDPDKVVVYASPEGDEVATYTRGTARLDAGEARIPLGTTFQWVTNPDVGLTAHLTPHGDCLGLYVESLTSDALVVRELGGGVSDVRFDYFVMGLRIGFEQAPIVQAKDREAPLPAAGLGAEFYADLLDPDAHTAFERFRQMEADVRGVAVNEVDMTGAAALREAIKASAWQQIGMSPEGNRTVVVEENVPDPGSRDGAIRPGTRGATGDRAKFDRTAFIAQDLSETSPDDTPASQHEDPTFPVSEPVEIGDLLALDPEDPGVLRRADSAADPNVIGIVVEQPIETDEGDQAPVALYGLAIVNADASHGAILPGDLLVSSPTPGHVMRATVAAPGTVVGKALEPLEAGTGSIRVLVMPR